MLNKLAAAIVGNLITQPAVPDEIMLHNEAAALKSTLDAACYLAARMGDQDLLTRLEALFFRAERRMWRREAALGNGIRIP